MGVRALGDVCGSKTDPSGLRAHRTAFVIPARRHFFFPKLQHTERGAFLAAFLKPPDFCAHCWWVHFILFLIPWTMGYDVNIH